MISWKTVRLGEIGTFTRSFGIAKTELMSGGLNAIRYGELYTSHHIKIKTILSFVAPTAIVNSIKVEKGDILFATSGETAEEIGKSAIYLSSEECYAGGDILVFTPLANNNPLFLSYLLNSWVARRKLSRLGQGQSIVHIYKHNLEELTLKLPDTLQQDTIVSVLETWDQYLENLDKKIEIEKNIKKGLMQQIFSKKIRFKDDNGNDYSGRRRFRFDEAFTFLRTNSLSRAELSNKGTIMNIHYGDIHTKLGSNFDAKRDGISYAPSNAPRLSDICQDGDLVIADASEDRTDVGKAVEIINTAGCQIVAGLHTFLCRPQGVAVGFSGYLMQSQNMKSYIYGKSLRAHLWSAYQRQN